jgi:hypothetical protein
MPCFTTSGGWSFSALPIGQNCFQEVAEVTVDLFFPRTSEPYARAIADAINAVPVPEKVGETA